MSQTPAIHPQHPRFCIPNKVKTEDFFKKRKQYSTKGIDIQAILKVTAEGIKEFSKKFWSRSTYRIIKKLL